MSHPITTPDVNQQHGRTHTQMFHVLVDGLEHEFYFSFHIWDVILPIDELIFFRGVETTNRCMCICIIIAEVRRGSLSLA